MNTAIRPRSFDLDKPEEVDRLLREVAGYLHTCRREHHGTDFTGRQYAIQGVETLRRRLSSQNRAEGGR